MLRAKNMGDLINQQSRKAGNITAKVGGQINPAEIQMGIWTQVWDCCR